MANIPLIIAQNLNMVNPRFRTWVYEGRAQDLIRYVAKIYRRGIHFFDLMTVAPGIDAKTSALWVMQTLQGRFQKIQFVLDVPGVDNMRFLIPACQNPCILNGLPGWPPPPDLGDLIASNPHGVIVPCSLQSTTLLTPQERLEIALEYHRFLREAGLPDSRIYLDAQLFPMENNPPGQSPVDCLETIRLLTMFLPGCYRLIGLSNLTFRARSKTMPQMTFLTAAVTMGLNAVILNAMNRALLRTWYWNHHILQR